MMPSEKKHPSFLCQLAAKVILLAMLLTLSLRMILGGQVAERKSPVRVAAADLRKVSIDFYAHIEREKL